MTSSPFSANAPDWDLIIRCRDGVDLHTGRAVLARASSHFSNMQMVAQKDPQGNVLDVAEESLVWDRLLRWLDVRCIPLDDNLNDLSVVIEPILRFIMESVKSKVIKALHRRLKESPEKCFRIWAMALRLHDQPLAAAAARVSVRYSAEDRSKDYFVDYDDLTASNLLSLDRYRNDIREKVNDLVRQDSAGYTLHRIAFWSNNMTHGNKFYQALDEYDEELANDIDTSDHNPNTCPWCPPVPNLPEVLGLEDIEFTQYRRWFSVYLKRLPDELAKCPSKDTIAGIPEFAHEALRVAAECEHCRMAAIPALIKFNKKFGDKIEEQADLVKIPIFTAEL